MKANAVPHLLSSLVRIDQYNKCDGMTSFMEFMGSPTGYHNHYSWWNAVIMQTSGCLFLFADCMSDQLNEKSAINIGSRRGQSDCSLEGVFGCHFANISSRGGH